MVSRKVTKIVHELCGDRRFPSPLCPDDEAARPPRLSFLRTDPDPQLPSVIPLILMPFTLRYAKRAAWCPRWLICIKVNEANKREIIGLLGVEEERKRLGFNPTCPWFEPGPL